ncbi:unnamed protein product [Rotaria magnacalcarata]|nr:unnamed protein product [Rotaria magnacalcarata]
MTSLAERRALVLAKVVKKADEHSRVFKEFEVVQEEKEKLKRYLQQMQIQLDTAVRLTCELRESSSEKGLALELLSTKLQEDKADRRKVTSVLNSALKLLQEGIFGVTDTAVASTDNAMGKVCGISNTTLTQLVDMLSSAEGVAIPDENPREERGDHHEKLASEPLVTYSAGDLGLVPKKAKGKHKPQ